MLIGVGGKRGGGVSVRRNSMKYMAGGNSMKNMTVRNSMKCRTGRNSMKYVTGRNRFYREKLDEIYDREKLS